MGGNCCWCCWRCCCVALVESETKQLKYLHAHIATVREHVVRWKREQILDNYEDITGDDTLLLDAAFDYTMIIEISE